MEFTLHRQLKAIYGTNDGSTEVRMGRYRIDAIRDGVLIEIQLGSLAAIRDKIRSLLEQGHRVLVVKPLLVEKRLVKLDGADGRIRERRLSPKRQSIVDLFHELIYFTRVYPHESLTLEVPLLRAEELRYPGHGRRRRWRRRDHQVQDQRLTEIVDTVTLRTGRDLLKCCGCNFEAAVDTQDLAQQMGTSRWVAQRVAYCLREMGVVKQVGKRRNAWLYQEEPVAKPKSTRTPRLKPMTKRRSSSSRDSKVA